MKYDPMSVGERANEFISGLPCRIQKPYPSAQIHATNERVANMLLSAFGGGENAELTAITQYIQHSKTISNPEYADLIFCIALIEMRHLDMIGTMIKSLGGEVRYWRPNHDYWSGGNVDYGNTDCEKLSLDIFSEETAIEGYEELIRSIALEKDPAMAQVISVIERIIEDEKYHLTIFQKMFELSCR
jgi:bacterioferritin